MKTERPSRPRPPLDAEALDRLALFYVGRYATTRHKLASYLTRKLRERGWASERPPDLAALTDRLAGLGYIDDRAFATARAASLQRRGYGGRRVDQALYAAGIGEADAAEARRQTAERALAAALRFAEKRRIGPYGAASLEPDARRRAFAAMLRAGHAPETVRRVLDAAPGEIPDCDSL